MIKSYKVKLLLNNRQKTLLSKSGGTARWAYNFFLARQKENYDDGGTFISDGELRKEITQLKKTDEYDWLGEVSAPRVKFDGINWWLTVGVEVDDNQVNTQKTEAIGIDLGVKTLAVCSNGMIFSKPDIRDEIEKLRRLQKRASRYYEKLKQQGGENRCKSARLKKLESEIRKVHQRITSLLQNNIHQMTTQLIKLNPEAIVLEDLNGSGMLKNRHLSNSVRQAKFYEIRRQLDYKCKWNHVEFVLANRFYPSSKTCSSCGLIKRDLRLSDRVFVCECGLEIDRDFNASLNLKRLAG